MAAKMGIESFPSPAGGCLLTTPEYGRRLLEMLTNWPDCTTNDVALLKSGRVYWLPRLTDGTKALAIIGRDSEENARLESLAAKGDIVMMLQNIPGPTCLLRAKGLDWETEADILPADLRQPLRLAEHKPSEAKTDSAIIQLAALLAAHHSPRARGITNQVKLFIK
jgi:hypothetical protein